MRPLSLENLRRLVGRRKDKNEPSFKRSESFKRISIRKSYLDRGKRRNKLKSNSNEGKPDEQQQQQHAKDTTTTTTTTTTIAYGEWLHGVSSGCSSIAKEPLDNSSRKDITEELTLLSIDEPDCPQRKLAATSNDRISLCVSEVSSSCQEYATRAASSSNERLSSASPSVSLYSRHRHQKACCSSSNERLSNSEIIVTTSHEPYSRRQQQRVVTSSSNEKISEENGHTSLIHDGGGGAVEGPPPSVSVSLGRVWRDSVVPVVPYPAAATANVLAKANHNRSLDSAATKDKRPQVSVARTVSAPDKSVSVKESNTTSSSSSPFSFSLKITKWAKFGRR